MAYIKTNFRNGNVLYPKHMNTIEETIANLQQSRDQQGTIVAADYGENSPILQEYIRNRPFYYYETSETYSWDGQTLLYPTQEGMSWIDKTDIWTDFASLVGQTIEYEYQNQLFSQKVLNYINSANASGFMSAWESGTLEKGLYVVDMGDLEMGMSGCIANLYFFNDLSNNTELNTLGAWITAYYLELSGISTSDIRPGLYSFTTAFCQNDTTLASFRLLSLDVAAAAVDPRYIQFFNEVRSKSYAYAIVEDKVEDYSKYPAGSVILLIDTSAPATFKS